MKKLVLLMIAALFSTSSYAGLSIDLAIPETLTPTTDSEVRNPVTLEATEYSADPNFNQGGTVEIDHYQWLIGEWDFILKDTGQAILDLPFTFTLNEVNYDKIGLSHLGYVVLLPSDFNMNFNAHYLVSRDWQTHSQDSLQYAGYPTIFPLAKNDFNQHLGEDGWYLSSNYNVTVEAGLAKDAVLAKLEENQVTVFSNLFIQRNGNSGTTTYPLKQVVILHSNGDIELHFDTTFPFEELLVETEASDVGGHRYYSGVMIPKRTVNETSYNPLPMITEVTTNGSKSFLFKAATLAETPAENFPTDGSVFTEAAPTAITDASFETLEIPFTRFLTTLSPSTTLDFDLGAGKTYQWASRQVVKHTSSSGEYESFWESEWSEMNRFSVVAEQKDDDDDGFLGLGSVNPFLILCVSLLLFIRKQK